MIICMKTRSSIYVSKGLGSNGDIIADDGKKKQKGAIQCMNSSTLGTRDVS